MRSLQIFCFLLFASVVGFSQDAASVKDLDKTIKSYNTYNWLSDIDEIPDDKAFIGPNGILIFNNESARKMIKDAISTNLQAKGYTMTENNPDMLVGFQVLEQEADFRTYTGYETIFLGLDTVRSEENVERVTVGPGTLFINIVDAQSGALAWQGYAPGALNEESVKSAEGIKSAVFEVLGEFDYSAFNTEN